MPELEVTVFDKGERRCTHLFAVPVEVGRQRRASETLYSPLKTDTGVTRLVVAEGSEDTVGRRHALIELIENDRVCVNNLSTVQPVYFEWPAASPLLPGENREVGLPQLIRLGKSRVLRLQTPGKVESPVNFATKAGTTSALCAIGAALSKSTASSDLAPTVAQLLVDVLGVDQAWVLLWASGEWHWLATWFSHQTRALAAPPQPDRNILDDPCILRRLLREQLPVTAAQGDVILAPLISPSGEALGAIYCTGARATQPQIALVELLARAVAIDLAAGVMGQPRPLRWAEPPRLCTPPHFGGQDEQP